MMALQGSCVLADQPKDSTRDDQPPRQPYVAPELIEYGTVAKLTQTGGRTRIDFFFGLRRRG
jgi:hypothetical protein